MHALIHCSHGRSFWGEAEKWFDFKLPRLHPTTWARYIISYPIIPTGDRAKIVSVMWSIWHSRNRIKHGEEGRDPTTTICSTKEAIALADLPRKAAAILSGFGWRPPEEGVVKITMDGALNFEDGRGMVGGVS